MFDFVTNKPTKKCMEIKYNFIRLSKIISEESLRGKKCLFKHIAYNAMRQSHVRKYIHFCHIHREKKMVYEELTF